MILSCIISGNALNTADKICINNNILEHSYYVWKYLNNIFLDPTQKDVMIFY